MKFVRGSQRRPRIHNARIECGLSIPPQKAKAETICRASRGGREGGSGKAKVGWGYKRSVIPGLVGKHCGNKEEE